MKTASIKDHRVARRLRLFVWFTVILYILLGFTMAWQAYAQTKSVIDTGTELTVPSGSDDKSVAAYYDYLNESAYLAEHETYVLDVPALGWTYGFLGAMLVVSYFYIGSWYARLGTHDLYPVESYNGYITERGGPVPRFNNVFYMVIGSFMAYYGFIQILYGQLY